MKTLSIDLETFGPEKIGQTGAYRYAETAEILLFAYSIDDGPVQIADVALGETVPTEVVAALQDVTVTKYAFNAAFERVVLSHWLRKQGLLPDGAFLDPAGWHCTMVHAAYCGLPMSLKNAGAALGLDEQKMEEGKALIRRFCVPRKPSKNNPDTRFWAKDDPERWAQFTAYCIRDVEVETAIRHKLPPAPPELWAGYCVDQRINDRGVRVDLDFVAAATAMDDSHRAALLDEAKTLTGLANPHSPTQLRGWLADHGCDLPDLTKATVADAVARTEGTVHRVLELRQELSKSSVTKYRRMAAVAGTDGRARGLTQYYGAGRTGRWAGRLIQVQNLPQNHLTDLDAARDTVAHTTPEVVEMLYDSVPDTLSQLIRTALVPTPGRRFVVADYSAIEARVIAWLAGQDNVLRAFERGEDIYCATASAMFGVPVVKHGENGELRQKGKVAALACIAAGQEVLTDKGLVPIEHITTDHKVWDGLEWVTHDGLVYKGVKNVITYDGLTATPDHKVWIDGQDRPVRLIDAAANGAHLTRSGGVAPTGEVRYSGQVAVYDLLNCGPRHRFTVSGRLVHNCGYGGSVGAIRAMGGDRMGMTEADMQATVDMWRRANPHIVDMWWALNNAALDTVKTGRKWQIGRVRLSRMGHAMTIELPSGRTLIYPNVGVGTNRFGGESITYWGPGLGGTWERQETYGGKLAENITQAVARDLLAHALSNMERYGLPVVFHVHDEVVVDAHPGVTCEHVADLMAQTPGWAAGLPVTADAYECQTYRKD